MQGSVDPPSSWMPSVPRASPARSGSARLFPEPLPPARALDRDIVVDFQADEPFADPDPIGGAVDAVRGGKPPPPVEAPVRGGERRRAEVAVEEIEEQEPATRPPESDGEIHV